MIRFIEDSGGPDAFTSIKVVDWDSHQRIDAASATYVIGTDSISVSEFRANVNPMMGPKEMTSTGQMYMLSHGIIDKLSMRVKLAHLEKEMVMDRYMMGDTVTKK